MEIVEIDTLEKASDLFKEAKLHNEEIQKSQHVTGEVDLDYIESNVKAQILHCYRNPSSPNKIKIWAIKKDGKYVGSICFNDYVAGNSQNASRMLYETFWMCWGDNLGYAPIKLLKTAENYAKEHSIKYISMSRMTNTKSGKKLKEIYEKMGYKEDTATHIKKL